MFNNFYHGKRILITGHTGFKGGWLAHTLLKWGAHIIGIALKPTTSPNLFTLLGIEKRIHNYFVDIRNFSLIQEIFQREQPEIVFHLAAQPLVRESYDDPLYTFETNIGGTANILQATKENGKVKAGVIITTDKVYEDKKDGQPYKENDKLGGYDPYSASKAGAEIIIDSYIKSFFNPKDYNKRHKTLIASARSGNVIGGGDWARDRLVPDIIKAVFEKNQKVIIRNPNSIRPWQYVLEPLLGYLLLAKGLYEGRKEFSGAWNFGPDDRSFVTVKELLESALKILKRGAYTIKKDKEKHETEFLKLDNTKSKSILGWQPTLNLNETLKLTFLWYQTFYKKGDIMKITDEQIQSFFDAI